MRFSRHTLAGVALATLVPLQVLAYYSPEDVLLSKEFFLPPTPRDSGSRIERQVTQSAARRESEQNSIFSEQYAAEAAKNPQTDLRSDILGDTETLRAAAPEPTAAALPGGLDAHDLELLKTVRLLDQRETRLLNRVQDNQQIIQYYGSRPDMLHAGAPPLAPTGAGGILSALIMIGAVGWTLLRTSKGRVVTRLS